MVKKCLPVCLFILSISASAAFGQNSAPGLGEIIDKASKQSSHYTNTFKNLIAEESKTIEVFDENGNIEKRRKIVSTFIVYQLANNAAEPTEFRNVLSVDGKPIKGAEKRARRFFEKIVSAESSEKEHQKLNKESLRYDKYLSLSGFTISKAIALSENLIPFFDFEITGKENFNGRDVFVLSYKQLRESPDIKFNASSKDIELNARLSGLLWVDAETFQIWREESRVTIQPEIFDQPVTSSEWTYEYQKSDFGILTPKKITYTNYAVKARQKTSVKDASLTLEYSKFSRPDATIESAEVK